MKWYTEDDISKDTLEAWALKHGKTAKQVRKRRGNIRRLIRLQQAARAEEAEDSTPEPAGDADRRPRQGKEEGAEKTRPRKRAHKQEATQVSKAAQVSKASKPAEDDEKPQDWVDQVIGRYGADFSELYSFASPL